MAPLKTIKDCKCLDLVHDAHPFCSSQWKSITHEQFFSLRAAIAGYNVITLLLSFYVEGGLRWCFLLTTWTHVLVIVYFCMSSLFSLQGIIKQRKLKDQVEGIQAVQDFIDKCWRVVCAFGAKESYGSRLHRLHLLHLNIVTMSAIAITVCHWPLVQDYSKPIPFNLETYLLIDRHGINVIFLLMDIAVSGSPIKFMTFVHCCAFSALYTSCNFAVWYFCGLKVYDLLDYQRHPWHSFLFFASGNILLIPTSQYLLCILHNQTCKSFSPKERKEH